MNNQFDFLFDKEEESIYDMGLAPLVGAMCESLAIPETINQTLGPRDKRAVLDFGFITKAFIIDMLTERSLLLHFSSAFEDLDCEVLFGEGVTADLFTEDRLGDTLDALSELDQREVVSFLSLRALKIHGVPVNLAHIDTTNFSLYGDFTQENPADESLVQYGKPKNGRKDLKLVTLAGAVQQNGLPIFGEGLSGNTSDAVWFRDAMDEMASIYSGGLDDNPILVYDAAASNTETFDKAFENHMPCIIRLSKRFGITGECIQRSWAKDLWQDVGVVAGDNAERASSYRISSFDVKLGENEWRVLIVHSSALERTKEATASRKLPEVKEKLSKAAVKLGKRGYDTLEEATKAADEFVQARTGLQTLFGCEVEVGSETIEKYERPGRPGLNTKKIKNTTYHAIVTIGDVDPCLYQKWLEYESCFAIAANVPKTRCTDEDLLKEYKHQWKIENCYQFVKSPKILEPLWLHKPERIKALLFILWMAVLVATYLRHRMHESLQRIAQENPERCAPDSSKAEDAGANGEEHQDENSRVLDYEVPESTETTALLDEVIANSVSSKILLSGGRLVERPTFKAIRSLFENIQTKGFWEKGEYNRKFPRQTRRRLIRYIVYMGFHPSIYLEPFHPKFDLWNYASLKGG